MPNNNLPHDLGSLANQLLEHMPADDHFQLVADIFKQLGDGNRIRRQRTSPAFASDDRTDDESHLSDQTIIKSVCTTMQMLFFCTAQ